MSKCIFCKLVKDEINFEKIYENENFFSIYDHFPHTEGHALVISKKHFNTVLDMPNSLGSELMNAIKSTALKLTEKYKSDGFNFVINNFKAAGQEVNHFHVHILPRKQGDGFQIFVPK